MNQDEIIEMARQVGFFNHRENYFDCTTEQIEAFAKLVAAKEREVCALLAATPVGTIAKAIRARGEPTSRGEA